MLRRGITRRLFLVPIANNDHGKTRLILAMLRQGERRTLDSARRGAKVLSSPKGRSIDALVFSRSYQETLRSEFGSILQALDGVDPSWRTRDLVVLPSHIVADDCTTMIGLAHGAGFDVIAVNVLLDPSELAAKTECLTLPWDERWTLSNDRVENPEGQIDALGHDLWTWVSEAIEDR